MREVKGGEERVEMVDNRAGSLDSARHMVPAHGVWLALPGSISRSRGRRSVRGRRASHGQYC